MPKTIRRQVGVTVLLDVTPRAWLGMRVEGLAMIVAWIVAEYPIAEVRATRDKLIVALLPPADDWSPDGIERIYNGILAGITPHCCGAGCGLECNCDCGDCERAKARRQRAVDAQRVVATSD